MSKTFEIQCSTCNKNPHGDEQPLIIAEGFLEYENDEGEYIQVIEQEKNSKLSRDSDDDWRDLIKLGRVFTLTNLICQDCGKVTPERQVHHEAFGCWVYIFVPAFVWINCQYFLDSWLIGLLLSWAALVCAWFAQSFLYNKKWGDKNKQLRLDGCPHCKSENLLIFQRASLENVKCSNCDNFTMKVKKS